MVYLKAVLLAIVEGLTEFLPVSSTGHMILVDAVVRLSADESFNDTFIVAIQLPAVLSVLVYFWKQLWPFAVSGDQRRARMTLWFRICCAVVPAMVLGLLFDDILEEHLFAPFPVAIALALGGVLLILLERIQKKVRYEHASEIGIVTAIGIGFFQCLAMIPGTSRSAASIIGAMFLGASRPAAAEFSFFLAIPTMLAATTYSLTKHGFNFSAEQWLVLGVGSVFSFFVALASVHFLMSYVKRHSFAAFGYYRIVLAAIVILALALNWIEP